ncbi:unnamed protein product, partial [Hymenolepis diminuta]
ISNDVSSTSTANIPLVSSNNSTQSPFLTVHPLALPLGTRFQTESDDMKLHLSIRYGVKVTNLRYSMKSSIPKVVSARFVSEPTVPDQQSVPKSWTGLIRGISYLILVYS